MGRGLADGAERRFATWLRPANNHPPHGEIAGLVLARLPLHRDRLQTVETVEPAWVLLQKCTVLGEGRLGRDLYWIDRCA